MIRRNTYKYLSGLSLVILLLAASALIGCSENENKREGNNSFFKISVKTESYGDKVLTRTAGKASADTIITPIDDDLYMETVLCNDTEQSGGTTRASSVAAADVKDGTEINVLAYDESNNYKGKINGQVSTNGNVTMQGDQLQLEPGTYTFVCLANVEIEPENTPTYFNALKGKNSMCGSVKKTINDGDQDCKLAFELKHKVGQIKVTIKTESTESFSNLTAALQGILDPTKQKIILPNLIRESEYYGDGSPLNDVLIENQTGREFTSKDENYYIAGYDYTTEATINLKITSGTIGGQSIVGKSVRFKNFDLQYNNINKVTVTFKKQSQNYQFALQAGSQTQIAATGGQATGIITSTLNNASQPWEIESLSTTALTESSLQTLDAVNSGIVTSYAPKNNAGINNGSFSITMTTNIATTSRKIYVRLKQKDSGKTVILTITQSGSTPVAPPESSDGSAEESPWTEGGDLNGTVESEWP